MLVKITKWKTIPVELTAPILSFSQCRLYLLFCFSRMDQRLLEKFSHLHPHSERGDGFRGRHLERRDGVGAVFQAKDVRADVAVVGNGVVLIRSHNLIDNPSRYPVRE